MKRKFSEVLNIINGKNQKSVENPHGHYPIYGSGGIMGYADSYLCPGNTVIIGRKGNINKPIYVDKPFWNVDTAFGLQTNEDILLPKYLFYFCQRYNFEQHNKTVTIPSLTKSDLLEVEISVPELATQKQVCKELDTIEALILNRNIVLKKLDNLIKSRFIEMFGDPVMNPMGWEVKKLKDLSLKISDGVHAKPNYTEDGKPFISVVNITTGHIDFSNCKFVSQEDYEKMIKSTHPEKGDVLYTKVGATYGIPAYVDTDEDFCLYVSVCLIKPKHELVNARFLTESMRLPYIKHQADRRIRGIGVPDLHLNQIREFDLVCPPLDLQERYMEFVDLVDKSKFAIQQSIDTLQTLKAKLMQDYFG